MPPERLPRPFRGVVAGFAATGDFSASVVCVGAAAAAVDVTVSRALDSAAPAPAAGIGRVMFMI